VSKDKLLNKTLTQSEANLILLALELYEQSMSLSGQSKSAEKAKELWDNIFNEGLEAFRD
jgi:hypothetical protein